MRLMGRLILASCVALLPAVARADDAPQPAPAGTDLQNEGAAIPPAPLRPKPVAAPDKPVDCTDPTLLGTSRTIAIDPTEALHVGLKTYPQTLALADHEVVLTFDDGPSLDTTKTVLDALAHQCVKATFFLIGRNAKAHPALVRREIAEGHSVGHHSNTHPSVTLRGLDDVSARDDIAAGIAADERAGYGAAARPADHPHVPFFRFPGFADTKPLLGFLDAGHVAVFGADLWAADWLKMTPEHELKRVMDQLENPARHGGIILFHDTRPSTAAMLPAFLRALKAKGYGIVHLAPSETAPPPALEAAPAAWTSETEAIIAHVWPKIMPGAKHALAPKFEVAPKPDMDPTRTDESAPPAPPPGPL